MYEKSAEMCISIRPSLIVLRLPYVLDRALRSITNTVTVTGIISVQVTLVKKGGNSFESSLVL